MSHEHQNENTNNCEQPVQKPKPTLRRIVALVIMTVFIVLNALVILFGFLPSFLPFLRLPFTISVPWHFFAAYGTPLNLAFLPGLVVAMICSAHILLCRKKLSHFSEKGGLARFCIASVAIGGVCVFLLTAVSDRPGDHVRNALLQNASEDVSIEVQEFNWGGGEWWPFEVVVFAPIDVLPINDFEAFVIDMQPQMWAVSQNARMISFVEPDVSWRYPHLSWRTYSGSGEFGDLFVRAWEGNRWIGGHRYNRYFFRSIPVTYLQEILDAALVMNNFSKDLVHKMHEMHEIHDHSEIGVSFVQSDSTEIETGKLDVQMRLFHDSLSVSDVEALLIEMDMQVRELAQQHGMEVHELWITLFPYDSNWLWWRSIGDREYGTLTMDTGVGSPIIHIDDVHITEVQALLDDRGGRQ
ncbi:MAG: hypothetical protein FWC72_05560 [Oscillospiraceae bacterium]|nr:hypothetical protein [Oscillospiraceae bacterium]